MDKTESTNTVDTYEAMAADLMRVVFAICQERTKDLSHPPAAPERTLSAAAVTLQEAIKTFSEASRIA